jgi:spore maturation protein CgeB
VRSKICLNAHAEPEISWEPRMQMMLSCGVFVMSEKITPNKFIRPNIDYIEYNGTKDLLEKAEYFLKHESERERIAKSGRERILEILDSRKAFPDLINKIENGEILRFQNRPNGNLFFNLICYLVKRNIIK